MTGYFSMVRRADSRRRLLSVRQRDFVQRLQRQLAVAWNILQTWEHVDHNGFRFIAPRHLPVRPFRRQRPLFPELGVCQRRTARLVCPVTVKMTRGCNQLATFWHSSITNSQFSTVKQNETSTVALNFVNHLPQCQSNQGRRAAGTVSQCLP